MALGDDIVKIVAVFHLLPEQLDGRQITERLDAANRPALLVPQDGRADADRYFFSLAVQIVDSPIHRLTFRADRVTQGTVRLADVGLKNVEALFADGLGPWDSRNPFGGPVERGDIPILIDGEDAVGNRVQDHFPDALF